MPNYCYRCKKCGGRELAINAKIGDPVPVCTCGEQMVRDYKEEGAVSTFNFTRDIYLQKKKQDAKKSPHEGDYYRSRQ